MLTSSHTISIWSSWGHVPQHIQDVFNNTVKDVKDLVVFVPNVVGNGIQVPDFLKALNVGEGVKLSTGVAYVGKGKDV
jgi:hypothetical protein